MRTRAPAKLTRSRLLDAITPPAVAVYISQRIDTFRRIRAYQNGCFSSVGTALGSRTELAMLIGASARASSKTTDGALRALEYRADAFIIAVIEATKTSDATFHL